MNYVVVHEGRKYILVAVVDFPPQACLADPETGQMFMASLMSCRLEVAPPDRPKKAKK